VKGSELQREMHRLSGEVKEQFAEVRERFAEVRERFAGIGQRFEQVDREFVAVRAEIAHEGEATRRHFDMVAEQMKADNALLAAGIAELSRKFEESRSERQTVTHILDDHELRLKTLERRRSR
jgi:phage host-nuclease inhibitor protein Gam